MEQYAELETSTYEYVVVANYSNYIIKIKILLTQFMGLVKKLAIRNFVDLHCCGNNEWNFVVDYRIDARVKLKII